MVWWEISHLACNCAIDLLNLITTPDIHLCLDWSVTYTGSMEGKRGKGFTSWRPHCARHCDTCFIWSHLIHLITLGDRCYYYSFIKRETEAQRDRAMNLRSCKLAHGIDNYHRLPCPTLCHPPYPKLTEYSVCQREYEIKFIMGKGE